MTSTEIALISAILKKEYDKTCEAFTVFDAKMRAKYDVPHDVLFYGEFLNSAEETTFKNLSEDRASLRSLCNSFDNHQWS